MKYVSKQNGRAAGFTIVEAMIVLAIAGMILLVVLLAIPAVQRNTRNTQRKRDANIMATIMGEYITNQRGAFPIECNGNPGPNCDTVFLGERQFSYYETKNVSFKYRSDTNNDGFPPYNGPGNAQWITIANYYKCQTLSDGNEQANHAGAGFNNIVLIYELETAGSSTQKKVPRILIVDIYHIQRRQWGVK